jgi:uncharacterized membrane protein YbhN (UPF0104 family)
LDDLRSFVDAFEAFAGHLASVQVGPLLLAILLHFLRLTARVRGWQNIVRAAYPELRIPFRPMFFAYWGGVAVNAITPARGGDIVKLYISKHRLPGTTYPTLGSTLVVETLFDFVLATVLLLVALQMGLLPGIPDLPGIPAFDWSFAVEHPRLAAFLVSILAAAAVLLITWASRHVVAFKERVRLGFAILGDWRRFLDQVVSWQALSWVFRLGSVFFFLRAFGVPATFETVLAVVVVGGLATTLPFTPGGVGTQQAVLVFALADWASRSAVLSFSVGMQVATLAVNVAIGFAAIALTLGTVRWREHVQRDKELRARAGGEPGDEEPEPSANGSPAGAPSRPAPRA